MAAHSRWQARQRRPRADWTGGVYWGTADPKTGSSSLPHPETLTPRVVSQNMKVFNAKESGREVRSNEERQGGNGLNERSGGDKMGEYVDPGSCNKRATG